MATHGHLLAPSHPGFGHSPEAASIDAVDDLAYLYLDLLAQQGLRDAVVIGCSLGGWITAEMAVKCTERVARLILVSPLGIKVGDRETRDIPDAADSYGAAYRDAIPGAGLVTIAGAASRIRRREQSHRREG